ncbi:MAG: hypothetical protein K5Q00_02780, partial [Gammaproteobacteria bacterium]|nr:hypothetical protein [Gammaproteobacteria bacterium]
AAAPRVGDYLWGGYRTAVLYQITDILQEVIVDSTKQKAQIAGILTVRTSELKYVIGKNSTSMPRPASAPRPGFLTDKKVRPLFVLYDPHTGTKLHEYRQAEHITLESGQILNVTLGAQTVKYQIKHVIWLMAGANEQPVVYVAVQPEVASEYADLLGMPSRRLGAHMVHDVYGDASSTSPVSRRSPPLRPLPPTPPLNDGAPDDYAIIVDGDAGGWSEPAGMIHRSSLNSASTSSMSLSSAPASSVGSDFIRETTWLHAILAAALSGQGLTSEATRFLLQQHQGDLQNLNALTNRLLANPLRPIRSNLAG